MIEVTAAVLIKNKHVLIGKRLENSHMGDLWEFPGGKIEANETPKECLKRELREELEIDADIHELIMETEHKYMDKTNVKIYVYKAKYRSGKFKLNDHSRIAWVEAEDFENYKFVEADLPIVEYLKNL
ncbi:8-oxo-dGTP diphosphatase MutT [Candidatus Parcubacteria bacterium]|nr:MAG: 8-oxo-dGTP diphosphatase MutT [Candidatus Parcubacteria bacterium]